MQIMWRVSIALVSLVLWLPTVAVAAPVVFEASGANPADIQAAVDDFRAFLGDNTGTLCQTPSQAGNRSPG